MADTVLETLTVELKDNRAPFLANLQQTMTRAKSLLGDVKIDLDLGNAEQSARRLKTAIDPLDESIKDVADRVKILRNAYVSGVDSEEDFRRNLTNIRVEMDKLDVAGTLSTAQILKLSNAMATAQRATDTLDGKMSKLGLAQQVNIALGNNLQNQLSRYGPIATLAGQGLDAAARGLSSLNTTSLGIVSGGGLAALPSVLGAVALGAAGLVAGLGLALAGLTKFVLNMADFADGIDQASQRTKLSTDLVQELGYVAEIAGGSFDDIEQSVVGFTQRLRGAEEGSDKQVAAFERLGIATKGLDGELKSIEGLYLESIKALQGLGNETEKSIAAQALFGRSAASLNPILNLTADEFDDLRQKAQDLGYVISGQTILTLAEFNDKWAEIQGQIQRAKVEIAGAFVPLLENTLIPLLQNYLVPLLQEGANKLQGLADKFFDASEEGETFRANIAGNVASIITFGAKLFAVGEIAAGLGGILLSPFVALGVAINDNLDRLKVFSKLLSYLATGQANLAFVEAANLEALGNFDAQGALDAGTAFAQGAKTLVDQGFGLLKLDEEGIKQNLLKMMNNTLAGVESGSRESFESLGEEGGLSIAKGLDSTKEDVAKAAREWGARLSEEVARGLKDADEAFDLLSPVIEKLKTDLANASTLQNKEAFNDTLAKLNALAQAFEAIGEAAKKAKEQRDAILDFSSTLTELNNTSAASVDYQTHLAEASERTKAAYRSMIDITNQLADATTAGNEATLDAIALEELRSRSGAFIDSLDELRAQGAAMLELREREADKLEQNTILYRNMALTISSLAQTSTGTAEEMQDSFARVDDVVESINAQFAIGSVRSYEFSTALLQLGQTALNTAKLMEGIRTNPLVDRTGEQPSSLEAEAVRIQRFLSERNYVANALSLLGLDDANQDRVETEIAKRMREYADGATARFLAEKSTVDNALALLGLDPKNVRNVEIEVDKIVRAAEERFNSLVNTLKDVSDVGDAVSGFFNTLADVTGSELADNLSDVAAGFADVAANGASFATSLATGNIAGAITSGIGLIEGFISILGDFSTNLKEFEAQALSTNSFLSEDAFDALKQTKSQNVGGLLGLFGVEKTVLDEQATQLGIDTFNTIANALAEGIKSGGDVDIKSLYQDMLLEAFILSPEIQSQILAFQEFLTQVFEDGVISPEEALQLDGWEETFNKIGEAGQEALGIVSEEAQKAAEEMQAAFETIQGDIQSALEGAFDADTKKEFAEQFDVGIDEIIKRQLIAGLADPEIAALAQYILDAAASGGIDENEAAEIERRKRRIIETATQTFEEIDRLFPDLNPADLPRAKDTPQTEVDFSRVPESIQLAVATPLLEASMNSLQASTVMVDAADTFQEAVSGGFNINITGLQTVINQWETIQTRTNAMYERVLAEGFTVNASISQRSSGSGASRTYLGRQ